MKKRLSRLLSALLCAALLPAVFLIPARAAVTLTAVNDTLLPLSDDTMPARLGGEMYVPYDVFSPLGVSSVYDNDVLSLSANEQTLSFSMTEGYVYDQELNSYPSPAYDRNGTIYVPVNLCCGKFGLMNSTISSSGQTILRLTDGNGQSDSEFAVSSAESVEQAVNQYYGYEEETPEPEPPSPSPPPAPEPETPTVPAVPETPPEPEPPAVEEQPTQRPVQVYLTFFGAPNEYTADILDVLRDSAREATFFLPADTGTWRDDLIRRIAAEGHSIALLLQASENDAPQELTAQIAAANKRLSLISGTVTRLVSNDGGCASLTEAQQDAIAGAGCRLWDSTLDSGDDTSRAAYAYATTAQQFAATNSSVVVRLHHAKETAETVQLLSGYMARQGIPCYAIGFSITPINTVGERR